MKRKASAAIAALSLLAVLAAVGIAAARIIVADAAGRLAAREDGERLAALLSPVRRAEDLADPGLRSRLAAFYARSPSLLLATVYERGVGIRWRIPADSSYLAEAENRQALPSPLYPQRSAYLVRAPLSGDSTGRLAADALYVTLSQATVFAALRDSTIGLGAWLLLLLAILLAARILSRQDRQVAWRTAGEAVPGGGAFDPDPEPREAPPLDSPPPPFGAEEEEFAVPALSIDLAEDGAELAAVAFPATEALPAGAAPRGLYSPRSGLGWEDYLPDRLTAELARSASFEQDLALVVLAIDGHAESGEAYASVAKAVGDFWSFKDLAFERRDFGFAVVLPNIDLDHALRMAEEFLKKLTFLLGDRREPLDYLPVFMGISTRAGRLVDAARLTQEADAALGKAREERDSHIMAFKPDPDKYRLFLASKGCG